MLVQRMLRFCLISFSIGFLATNTARSATCDGQRVALAIGIKSYPDNETSFVDPIANARRIAETMQRLGFETQFGDDLTKEQMQTTLEQFAAKVRPGAIAFFFFSGIGLQAGRHTYLIPTDAIIWSETDIRTYGFSLDRIIAGLEAKGAKIRIAVIDAARRNPFERRFRTSGSLGLAPIVGTHDTLAMYSTVPGAVFEESTVKPSPFVEEFVKEAESPGATAEEAFRQTRIGVSHVAQAGQRPWISSSLTEDVPLDRQACKNEVAKRDRAPAEPENPAPITPSAMTLAGALKDKSIEASAARMSKSSEKGPAQATALAATPKSRMSAAIIQDPALLEEMRDRLFEQNLDPGPVGSSAMDAAIRKFEKQAGLPDSTTPTDVVPPGLEGG